MTAGSSIVAMSCIRPAVAGMAMALAASYDVITHETSLTPAEREPCMWGRATLVMLASRICLTMISITEMVIAHLRKGGRASAGGAPGWRFGWRFGWRLRAGAGRVSGDRRTGRQPAGEEEA